MNRNKKQSYFFGVHMAWTLILKNAKETLNLVIFVCVGRPHSPSLPAPSSCGNVKPGNTTGPVYLNFTHENMWVSVQRLKHTPSYQIS